MRISDYKGNQVENIYQAHTMCHTSYAGCDYVTGMLLQQKSCLGLCVASGQIRGEGGFITRAGDL